MLKYINLLIIVVAVFLSVVEMVVKKEKLSQLTNWKVLNISIGLFERIVSFYIMGIAIEGFHFLSNRFAFFQLDSTLWVFVLGFVLVDLSWYLYHFLGHRVSFFWGIHLMHHVPEEFNFTVAFVNSPLGVITRLFFYFVLVLIGFPVHFIIIAAYLKSTYQYFLHTELWSSIPVLELLFVMPSHHRVHHAKNDIYIDKNYGGVFIIWDKLFGTFVKESEVPVYGITESIQYKNFISIQLHFFKILLKNFVELGWVKGVCLLFVAPEKQPFVLENHTRIEEEDMNGSQQALKSYVLVVLFLLCHALVIHFKSSFGEVIALLLCFIFITLINSRSLLFLLKNKSLKLATT